MISRGGRKTRTLFESWQQGFFPWGVGRYIAQTQGWASGEEEEGARGLMMPHEVTRKKRICLLEDGEGALGSGNEG